MHTLRKIIQIIILGVMALIAPVTAWAATTDGDGLLPESSYVLADSIGYGLHLVGLEGKLQAKLGGISRISYDAGRSITTPGTQIKKTALQSVDADRKHIATAGVIIIVLGMEQREPSFADSQRQLILKLKSIAPNAKYYWVDIGATVSAHVAGWNARNKLIYDNATKLGYTVISRYQAIFGPGADPLNITPGRNFPGSVSEPGRWGPGNIHGFDSELSQTIMTALYAADASAACGSAANRRSYVLGDSIAFGLQLDGLAAKLQEKLGGVSRINYDGGRSIVSGGNQIEKSALESVQIDKDFIAMSHVIIIILGTNQMEESFADSQQQLMQNLKAIAPYAKYYWVDIAATVSTQVGGWNARNKIIYDSAASLGYTVVSRYQAIFGPDADPLNITPGRNFPGSDTEPGYGGPGNIHGAYAELSKAIVEALSGSVASASGSASSGACVAAPGSADTKTKSDSS